MSGGARLCAKHQPQQVELQYNGGEFHSTVVLMLLRLVLQTQPRSVVKKKASALDCTEAF